MNDQIAKAKKFVRRNRTVLIFSAGTIVGATGMFRLMTRQDIYLAASPEKLQMLIDKPGGSLRWDTKHISVTIFNEMNPEV